MYGTDSATIINNCDTYVFMGGIGSENGALNKRTPECPPLDEVLYMPINTIVVIRRGERPVMTQRYNIIQDKLHQENDSSSMKNSFLGLSDVYENNVVKALYS